MRSSNGVWNLVLLVFGVVLGAIAVWSYSGSEDLITALTEEKRIAQESQNFGVASVDDTSLSYVDENGMKTVALGSDEIENFCIDILGN